jgi:Fic family protein
VSVLSGTSPSVDLIRRIRGEYLEMPGLRLTVSQAQRFFGLDAATCHEVLDDLQRSGFLSRAGDGRFTLAHAGPKGAMKN